MKAIENAGYLPGKEISLALDCAASEFFDPAESTYIEKKQKEAGHPFITRNTEKQIEYLLHLSSHYPIDSIEDGLDQNDWQGWKTFTSQAGKHLQIVGDDLFVTNPLFLKKGRI